MSTLQGDQTKYDELYLLYGEDYFMQSNEEVCYMRGPDIKFSDV